MIICGEFNCHACSWYENLFNGCGTYILIAILPITHARICKDMLVKCVNPSFINLSSTIIDNELPSSGIGNFNDYGNELISR